MNSLRIFQRYYFDDFTFNLFEKIVNLCDVNGFFIYSHHTPFRYSNEDYFNLINNATENLIILGIKDHYLDEMDNIFSEMTGKNPTKKFILIMSHENLKNKILKKQQNILDVLSWGGDWTNQIKFYQEGNIPITKKFTDFTFTCNMRRPSKDRQILLSLLYGLEINKFGLVTSGDWADHPGGTYIATFYKNLYIQHANIIKILENGCNRAKKVIPNVTYDSTFENDVFPPGGPPLNFENFRKYLKSNYEKAPIDIVAESEMTNESPFLTEKSLHCFYGKSMPIIISGKGAIQHCRDVGFDVFDDVIDHSYDLIDDRLLRIYSALDKNLHLLTNKDLIFNMYHKINPSRFDHNINIIKNHMCDFYEQRLINDYTKVIKQYKESKLWI